jgi:hypothetical protein
MRFAILLEKGSLDEKVQGMEVRWADPENRTLAQIVDSAIKRAAVGVPRYQLWEDIGYSRAQIERMKKMEKEQEDHDRKEAERAGFQAGERFGGVQTGEGSSPKGS